MAHGMLGGSAFSLLCGRALQVEESKTGADLSMLSPRSGPSTEEYAGLTLGMAVLQS